MGTTKIFTNTAIVLNPPNTKADTGRVKSDALKEVKKVVSITFSIALTGFTRHSLYAESFESTGLYILSERVTIPKVERRDN